MAPSSEDAVNGRDAELETVDRFLGGLGAGPAALVLRGEPGIGKTTIWHAAIARAVQESFAVLSCRPCSAETNLPYAGLGDLFAHVDDDLVDALPAPQRRALNGALLRVDAETSGLQQRAVSAATLNVIVRLAEEAPVVVAIDDLQWLDPPSARVLQFALRRVAPARVGVLLALRSDTCEDDPLALADALPPTRTDQLVVGPVELTTLDQMLQSRLRTAFLGPTLRRIHETSGGNPLFALELARSLLDPDANTVPGQPFPAPSTLPGLLGARLARISPPTRRALLAASALARPTVDLVLDATATDQVTRAALDHAVEAEVITVDDGTVRFTHPLLASVVYADASTDDRRRMHRRLAALVADPEEQARHLGLSADEPDDDLAAALEQAARHAASRGAPDAAAVLMEQSVDLTPTSSGDDALRRTLDAADHHIAAAEITLARACLARVLATSAAGSTRARALHRSARVSSLLGEFRAAPGLLEEALDEAGDDLALRASIERDLVWSLAQVGEVAQLLSHARTALDCAEASGESALVAEALDHFCMAKCLAGENVDPDMIERAIDLHDRVGGAPATDHPAIASGRLTLAMTLKWIDEFDKARGMLEALRIEHREHGDEGALTGVLFHLGELDCWCDNWSAATRAARECHDLAVRSDQGVAELRAMTLDAMVACFRGTDDAEATGAASLATAEAAGDWPAIIRIRRALGVHALSIGEVEEAVDHLARGIAVERSSGYDQRTVRIVPDAVEALVATGRWRDAEPLVAGLERLGSTSGRPWALATGARCRGLVQAATGHLDEAQASFVIAVREHDRLPRSFERARTLLCLGVVQRRARHQRAARESLDDALRSFDAVGAVRWADRARAELRRIAGRASSPLALTPTEEQIAVLVADGLTNNEVASSMFISVKTVEANLTRIYRKLGVSSRRELMRQWRGGPQLAAEPVGRADSRSSRMTR